MHNVYIKIDILHIAQHIQLFHFQQSNTGGKYAQYAQYANMQNLPNCFINQQYTQKMHKVQIHVKQIFQIESSLTKPFWMQ